MITQSSKGLKLWLTSARRFGTLQSAVSCSRVQPLDLTGRLAGGAVHRRFKSGSSSVEDQGEDEKPVQFSTSEASKIKPAYLPERADNPTSRTVSWFLSFVAFGLWFFVLREESDWDDNLSRSLYDRVDHMEKTNLITAINYYQRNNMDATPLIERLKELEAEEQAAMAEGQKLEAELEATAANRQQN